MTDVAHFSYIPLGYFAVAPSDPSSIFMISYTYPGNQLFAMQFNVTARPPTELATVPLASNVQLNSAATSSYWTIATAENDLLVYPL